MDEVVPHKGAEMVDDDNAGGRERARSIVRVIVQLCGRAQKQKHDVDSCGVRDLAEGPIKFDNCGGRVDHAARKAAAPPLEATWSILLCSEVDKYLRPPN